MEYAYVRKFVKDIWDEYADKIDAVIHTGMAGPGISTALRRGLLERG
jgi:hypothetical protein